MSQWTPLRALALLGLTAAYLVSASALAAQSDTHGRVLDAVTRAPIASAAVTTRGDGTLTDADGHFTLSVAAGQTIVVTRLGYLELRHEFRGGSPTLLLQPDPVLLTGVAVQVEGTSRLAAGTALTLQEVDREDLMAIGGTNAADALERLEGVSTSYTGSWGTRAALRGLSGERLQIMIDGNRVSRACTFGMDQGLATVDPATIERVEVLTGPGSALYGSGNVGGVINVVTRRPDLDGGTAGEVRLQGSSGIPGGGLGVSLGTAIGSLRLDASVDGASYDDYRAPDGDVGGSSYRQLTAAFGAEWAPAPAQLLSVRSQYYAGRDIGWPMRGGAEIPEETRKSVSVDWGWQNSGVVDAVNARAFYQRLDHHMVMSMIMPGMNGMQMRSATDAVSWSETAGFRSQLRLLPTSGLQIEAGLEAERLFAEGTRWTERRMGMNDPMEVNFRTWPGVRVNDVAAFGQARWQTMPGVGLSAGLRWANVDRQADVGESVNEWITTGNLGVDVEITSELGFRASVGRGYRTPDPMELYGLALKPDGFVYRGSNLLETERSTNLEATLAFERPGLGLSATTFTNAIDDMVVPTLAGDSVAGRPVREYRNVRDARLWGASGSFAFGLPAELTLSGTATFTRGEDRATEAALPMVPPLEGGVALRREMSGAVRWIEAEWTGAVRQDRVATGAGELETPGWAVTHLRAAIEVADSELVLGIENLFDELYRGHLDPVTLHRPGRNLFVRVSRAF